MDKATLEMYHRLMQVWLLANNAQSHIHPFDIYYAASTNIEILVGEFLSGQLGEGAFKVEFLAAQEALEAARQYVVNQPEVLNA